MASSSVQLIVLDFDGVVIESNAVKTEAFREVFSRFPDHAEAAMAYHAANAWKSRYDKIDYLLGTLGRPDDRPLREELAAEFSRRTLGHLRTVPFVRGAREFLEEFARRVPLYLASVTPQADLDQTLADRGLRHYFRDAYGCPPWTKVEAVRAALARQGCEPPQAVLVGDSPGDRRAAQEAGVEFIARRSDTAFDPPEPVMHADLSSVADVIRARLG